MKKTKSHFSNRPYPNQVMRRLNGREENRVNQIYRVKGGAVTAIMLSAIASIALAQDQNPPDQTLRATSRLVEVSVVVHDLKGAPVRDLTRDDFTVLDQGKQREIAVFQVAANQTEPSTLATSHPLVLNNRSLAQTERPTAVTVILFDALNLRSNDDAIYAKRELPKFLKTLHPGDPVAIYSLEGPTVRVLHDFSDDPQSLIHSTERSSGIISQWLSSPADYSTNLSSEKRIRIEWTLSGLESIAQHIAAVPGRKTLIWISSAFPLTVGFENTESVSGGGQTPSGVSAANAHAGDLEPYRERLLRLARVFNNIDLAVYPVDPSGLMVDRTYTASNNAGGIVNISEVHVPSRLQTVGEITSGEIATMNLIAAETGGLPFYNANALGESIARAVDDAKITYVLGFYPDKASWDGASHQLKILVNRSEVEVRARRSYFAGDAPEESEAARDIALKIAAACPQWNRDRRYGERCLESIGAGASAN